MCSHQPGRSLMSNVWSTLKQVREYPESLFVRSRDLLSVFVLLFSKGLAQLQFDKQYCIATKRLTVNHAESNFYLPDKEKSC